MSAVCGRVEHVVHVQSKANPKTYTNHTPKQRETKALTPTAHPAEGPRGAPPTRGPSAHPAEGPRPHGFSLTLIPRSGGARGLSQSALTHPCSLSQRFDSEFFIVPDSIFKYNSCYKHAQLLTYLTKNI